MRTGSPEEVSAGFTQPPYPRVQARSGATGGSGGRPASGIARELDGVRSPLYKWKTELRTRGARPESARTRIDRELTARIPRLHQQMQRCLWRHSGWGSVFISLLTHWDVFLVSNFFVVFDYPNSIIRFACLLKLVSSILVWQYTR